MWWPDEVVDGWADAVLPPALPSHTDRYPTHPNGNVRYSNQMPWLPPRSTCVHVVEGEDKKTMVLGTFYATQDLPPPRPARLTTPTQRQQSHLPPHTTPLTPMERRVQRTDDITIFEAKQRWRALSQNYAFNAIYSAVPVFYYDMNPLWQRLDVVGYVGAVVAVLVWVGWLIFGTVQVSQSSVTQCDAGLYQSALALVVTNWIAPVLFGIVPFAPVGIYEVFFK